jgi:hypothetical protein
VDIFDEKEVLLALATRFQADRGMVTLPGMTGSPLDPSSQDGTISCKVAFDCTKPLGKVFAERLSIPPEVALEKLLDVVQIAVSENVPLVEAIQQLRATGHPELPAAPPPPPAPWTPAQARALAQVVTMDHQRRVWIGSLEVTELVRRQYEQEISSAGAAQISRAAPVGEAVSSVSSPVGGPEQPKSFWLRINAELVIYGATERGAKVTIGGRPIKLNSDGAFSHRFALPDGQYGLPVVAMAADGADGRSADLKFSRSTEYRGAVETLALGPGLQAPYPADGTYV